MKPVALVALSVLLAGCISINVTKTNQAPRAEAPAEPVAVEKSVATIDRTQGVESALSSALPPGALEGRTGTTGR